MGARLGRLTIGKKFIVVALLIGLAAWFIHSSILRVREALDIAPGVPGLSAVTLGFLVLFLAGVGYGLWVLMVEHYLAFSLAREWLVETLRELEVPSTSEQRERRLESKESLAW
ncbi:hypothetical protein [Desulfothermobacter acidiphilus]|uniref:hypothetical protein n=1 Tax=Desulfothermobacter acidiphilus TaxID=1938353 RepID=UPI003F8AA43E